MISNHKKETQVALKKACALLNKVEKMVDEDNYCIDVLQQILAVNGLLKSAANKIYKDHLNSCFKNAMSLKDDEVKQRMIDEILRIHNLTQK